MTTKYLFNNIFFTNTHTKFKIFNCIINIGLTNISHIYLILSIIYNNKYTYTNSYFYFLLFLTFFNIHICVSSSFFIYNLKYVCVYVSHVRQFLYKYQNISTCIFIRRQKEYHILYEFTYVYI